MNMKFNLPNDDREIFEMSYETEGRTTRIPDLKLCEAIGHARDIAMTMREGDELIVSDPDGRIHYKETSGSIYFRK